MTDTRRTWKQRVASWRSSGQSAERFSAGRGFAASTLKWWASQLRDDSPVPIVRVAQLVRSAGDGARRGAVIIEGLDARVRITIEPGTDRETLETVLAIVCSSKGLR